MAKPNVSRAGALGGLGSLKEALEARLAMPDAVETRYDKKGPVTRRVETLTGVEISRRAGILTTTVAYEDNGVSEDVTITMIDAEGLSATEVEIDWDTGERSGSNTPSLRSIARLASEITKLLALEKEIMPTGK